MKIRGGKAPGEADDHDKSKDSDNDNDLTGHQRRERHDDHSWLLNHGCRKGKRRDGI